MEHTYRRTTQELKECTSYGKLYVIKRICGSKYLCNRVRRKGDELHEYPNDRVTVVRHKPSVREPRVGDFAFVSTDGVWSIFMVDVKNTLRK